MTFGKPAASSDDRPEWRRRLEDQIGEDPGRFLDHELVERGPSHTDRTLQRLARARIRGIDRPPVARAWIAAERRLDRGPRETVLAWLEDRLAYLEDHGDREERVDLDAVPPAEERVDRRTAEYYENMTIPTPKPPGYDLWGAPSERLAEKARAEGRTEAAREGDDELAGAVEDLVATDGGAPAADQEDEP